MKDGNGRPFQVRGLGEIAIRCQDLDAMVDFYRDIVGLDILSDDRDSGIVFFRIANGYRGHTAILALFRPDAGRPALHPHTDELPIAGKRSSLHHLALNVDVEDQEALISWLASHDLPCQTQVFGWIGWRGIFTEDPEGNTVEFVAYDDRFKG